MTHWRIIVLALAALAYISVPTALVAHSSLVQSVRLQTNGQVYRLEVANTPPARERGLGGRSSLKTNRGMLFVFNSPAAACIWMQNMRFPIDIIWTDSEKRIIKLESDISPDSFPQSFCPDTPAQYVIELPAGSLARDRIPKGQTLTF